MTVTILDFHIRRVKATSEFIELVDRFSRKYKDMVLFIPSEDIWGTNSERLTQKALEVINDLHSQKYILVGVDSGYKLTKYRYYLFLKPVAFWRENNENKPQESIKVIFPPRILRYLGYATRMNEYQAWIFFSELAFMRRLIDEITNRDYDLAFVLRQGPLIQQIPQYTRFKIHKDMALELLKAVGYDNSCAKEELDAIVTECPQIIDSNNYFNAALLICYTLKRLIDVAQENKIVVCGVVEDVSRSRILLRYLISEITKIVARVKERINSDEYARDEYNNLKVQYNIILESIEELLNTEEYPEKIAILLLREILSLLRNDTIFFINYAWLRDKSIEVGTITCLLYTSPSPRDLSTSRMPSSA